MTTVHIEAGKPYEAVIERGLIDQAGERLLSALGAPCAVAILTDDTVDALYGARVQLALEASGFAVCRHAMLHGEQHKNAASWLNMLDFLATNRLTRADCVLALGGGVVGDVAGFAAASYLRGVRLVQMPTTLLAMVDSGIGGKTGFDLVAGKNLAGAFYQPSAVLCDPDALRTLGEERMADGIAEAIKHGVIADKELFEVMRDGAWRDAGACGSALNPARKPDTVVSVISANLRIKAALVAQDERDTGARQLLNLGHTVGHAIERRSDYTISHGHAVGMGMVCAARLSHRLGLCDPSVQQKLSAALTANHLPTAQPFAADELCEIALGDKKRAGDYINFILPTRIGHCVVRPVDVSNMPRIMRLATQGGNV